MKNYSVAYLAALLTMGVIDLVWLGFIAKPLYQQGIGHLMSERPNIPVAALFYLLYPLGLLLFSLHFQPDGVGWQRVATVGALFGFFAYATYDLTNLATLRGWPVGLSLLDIAWGTLISAVTATAAKLAFDRMG